MGASGSGKSTLASLLTRTWDPASGTVTIGGQERPRNFVVKTMPALKAGENHTIEINF